MIITAKKEIPTRWVIFAILPWASFTFNNGVVGTAFIFSLKKFIENPAGLTFILSLPGILAIVISPIASFLSDRIWTRFGRRKPFIIASWTGMLTAMVLMPLMPNFWLLLAAYLLYHLSADLNSPMEPLKQEIIPPQKRGWATGAMTWMSNLATMVFYFIMLGRFDDVSFLAGLRIDGEWVIYWSASLLLFLLLLLIMLGIRETDPKSSLRGERLTIRNFAGGLLDRELWPVYLLVFGNACLNFYAGLGALSNLLYTDQWGYTKQEMGVNVAIGGIANVFIIALLTIFASRLNRMRAYQTTLILSLLGNIFYYCYVEFVLPDKRPTLVEIIVFGEVISILSILTGLLYIPLVYDYVRRNRMGTYAAGASIVDRMTRLITLNGVGLFVTFYATAFQPPAGEMTRVVLRDEVPKKELTQYLQSAAWPVVEGAVPVTPAKVSAEVWQANGVTAKQGRTWEIRHEDKEGKALAKEKENLLAEKSPLLSKEAMARDAAAIDRQNGKADAAAKGEQERQTHQVRIAEISKRIEAIDAELAGRAEKFRQQVSGVVQDRLIAESDQIISASVKPALVVELATASLPEPRVIEKILGQLRQNNAAIIDLRALKRDAGYGLAVSAFIEPGTDEAAYAAQLQSAVTDLAAKHNAALLQPNTPPLGHSQQSALTLDLLVVEEPVETYVSPITRTVNAVLRLFDRAPSPRRKLEALGRNLRSPEQTNHVRVDPGSAARTISITALLQPTAPQAAEPPDDGTTQKLRSLLGPESTALPQARAFYDRVEKIAAVQRLTVARPILASSYVPMRYDYMSGYLWMFVMGAIGITLTFVFMRLEKRGVIQKRGVEEALLS